MVQHVLRPLYITHYYYDTYAVGRVHNAVSNVAAPQEVITVFPNPATHTVNITRQGVAMGTYTEIKLVNAVGQTVRTETLPWMQATEQVSLAGLQPGSYWLLLQDKGGNVQCWQRNMSYSIKTV